MGKHVLHRRRRVAHAAFVEVTGAFQLGGNLAQRTLPALRTVISHVDGGGGGKSPMRHNS